MQAGDVKLGKVFANDHQSVIPIFQRPYVWDQEDNWEPLWKDVRTAAEEVEAEAEAQSSAGNSKPRTYFLGAVVVQERYRPPRRLGSSHIIDGQQRMTTLQVLFAAARAVAHGIAADSVVGRFTSLLENRAETVHEAFPDDRYKVWPLPQDRAAFLWAVRRSDDDGVAPRPDHRLVRARMWFEQEIGDWAKAASNPAQRLDDLYYTLQERMQLVEIVLDAGDDPQVIFEALNHRGVRLDAADLVKNLLFQTVESQGQHHHSEELLMNAWLPLDAEPWRGQVTTGRIRRALIDLLLAHWLTIQKRQDVLVEHLFADFKKWLPESGQHASDVIRNIRHYADTYQRLRELPLTDPTGRLLDRMQTMTTTPWPVLLYLHATEEVPNDQRAVAARAIDSFLMRRAVCLMTTKDYNRLFVQVLADAQESDPARAGFAVARSLWNQTAEARLWPDDQIFLEALIAPDLYRRSYRARLKALLVGLENHLRTPKTELAPILSSSDSRLNIEHVLPQKWETHWPLADGDSEKVLEKRHGAVHQLGNLTLTTTKLNPSLSNREWLRKKDELRAHSLLRLTTSSVLSVPEGLDQNWTTDRWVESWDEDRIQLRTLWLAGIALRAWPKPKADVD
ncbi:DUF262 domain-containing HNH endonuclease family protein [Streptomyces sp. NBC_00882]|uniref:DUF262 domain-containing protein n=1 Tax=Streptomyces TaxID=1883 RepID=UPI0038672A84|nr:DUF262 domain-containing HNH endonuclease family protein [Streptomyces sp. NBC_00882]WSZ56493.1 DUF262 domain-containing HNH endonuclease family protein [Streptomyces canus]